MTGQEPRPSAPMAGRTRKSLILAATVTAQFMVVLDFTIVQIALPSIGKEFAVSINGLQWLVTAYGLTFAGFLLLTGRAGDLYGHRKLFIAGVVMFSLASLAGGLAPSETVLVIARAVQGFAAAMTSSTGLSILTATFSEGRERNRALSVFAAATGLGSVAGMVAGGVITAALGWRWVFDINFPIGLAIAVLAFKYISRTATSLDENRHLDILGAVSVTGGLMLLVYALSIAQNIGIGSAGVLEMLGLSGIVLATFLFIEHRSRKPLMPLGFLRKGSIFAANALALLQLAGYVGLVFILTNYFQQVLGYSALSTGLAFLPVSVMFMGVSAFLSSRLVGWFGVRKTIISGMVIQTIGYVLLSSVLATADYFGGLLGPLLVIAVGTGFSFTAINIAALAGTKKGEEGLASGLINTSRQIGGPVGLAILLTVVNAGAMHSSGHSTDSHAALVTGFIYAFIATAFLTGIGVAFAFSLAEKKVPARNENTANMQ